MTHDRVVILHFGSQYTQPNPRRLRGFTVTGATRNTPIAAIEDARRGLFGIQFHPEVNHTAEGRTVLANFLDACGCRRDWNAASFIEESVAKVKAQVGDGRVI